MATADQLLRAGDIAGARQLLIDAIRSDPSAVEPRLFLFQLLAVGGEWDKARSQLTALTQLSPEAQMLSVAYGQAIAAEQYRERVFAGQGLPVLLAGQSVPGASDLVTALGHFSNGRVEEGEAARERAFDAAPDTPGEIDGARFDWIADSDSRFGPAFEAIINGQWGLVPFAAVERLESEGPQDLRDLVWYPVTIGFRSGQSVPALLPVRYPGSQYSDRADLRLARATDWVESPGGDVGQGQHLLSLSDGSEQGLLALRVLAFD